MNVGDEDIGDVSLIAQDLVGRKPPRGIRLDHFCKVFGTTSVIQDVLLEIEPGEFVVFAGPSGWGHAIGRLPGSPPSQGWARSRAAWPADLPPR